MMKSSKNGWKCLIGLAALCVPAFGGVRVVSMKPSAASPQQVGTVVTWTAKAKDTGRGPLTFQFNVAAPGGALTMIKDFNVGTLKAGTWTSQAFYWAATGIEGQYQVQVVIKDFNTGAMSKRTVKYQINPLVTGSSPVAVGTANPLVALFSAPSCPAGSSMRVTFQPESGSAGATNTNWVDCHPPATMTFQIGGMYANTTYAMFSQTETAGNIVNGPTVSYTTGMLPTNVPIPTFTMVVQPDTQTDTADAMILHSLIRNGNIAYPPVATDLAGNINWYYAAIDSTKALITRPLPNGTMLVFENGTSWNPSSTASQILRQVDLIGNTIRETNTGILQQLLVGMGAADAQACNKIAKPAPIGAACMGAFSHDAIQTLPNGYTAVQADLEKIYPPGTQGDTTGKPVDLVGDIIIVLDANWQPVWYFDAFEHAGGAPQLDITRPAVLGEFCTTSTGCPFTYLLGAGISPKAHDWLHGNALYYSPVDGDFIWSSRNQDWVMKVDYNNGAGTGNILWRMGLGGDFTFNNVSGDPYPWFSGQHEVGIENNGTGPMTIFDNGNTRVAPPPLGLGTNCGPADCNSRGMALTVDEVNMQVTPVMSVDLGAYSVVFGSAQLLDNGNYFFATGKVTGTFANDIQILPTPGTTTGTQVLNMQSSKGYRAWQMLSLYAPPTT